MTDAFIETPAASSNDRLQIIAAILLGIAATLTAFSAYQAALADGEALQGFTTSTRTLSDANAFWAEAGQVFALDQQLFVSYATANHEGNSDLAEYLETLMRDELLAAVEWWIDTEDAITPFDEVEENPYTIEQGDTADELEDQASMEFAEGVRADEVGDRYELAGVFFALTLFFGGVATLFGKRSVTLGLLSVGGLTMALGVARLVSPL